MKKRLKVMSLCLLLVFGGLILFNLIKAFMIKRFFASYQPPAVSVASAVAKEVNWVPTLHAVGNFKASNGVEVNAQSGGNVIQIHFESGQHVTQGQALVTLDDSVDKALLKFNQADLKLKNLNFQRQSDLFKRGAAPISSMDEAKATLDQASARLEQIEAQIEQKHIKAPFTGRLGIRQVDLGQYVSPGQTPIVSLQALDPLYLEFYLPEQFYKNIHPNQTILFSIEEFPQLLFEAKISAINSKVDLNTHNALVQATLANCPLKALKKPEQSSLVSILKKPYQSKKVIRCNSLLNSQNQIMDFAFVPGMLADIAIEEPAKAHTVIVPSTAISYSLYGNSVYVIEKNKEKPEQLEAKRVFVHTGEQRGNVTVIKKGLLPGQKIVSAGEIKLKNGTAVAIHDEVQLHDDLNTLGE